MTGEDLLAVAVVLGSSGLLAMLGAAAKEIRGWVTQRSGRRMTDARSALQAMNAVGTWQDAYFRFRQWCWDHHGWEPDYPPPPGGDNSAKPDDQED